MRKTITRRTMESLNSQLEYSADERSVVNRDQPQ
jgi:hypothetical protein